MFELIEEYGEWLGDNATADWIRQGYNQIDAQELLLIDGALYHGKLLTNEQRQWLNSFIERWDRQQALADRLEALVVVR